MPYGQLPVLEVDGKQLAQSKAICRYLAKELKLMGSNPWEEAKGDMIVDYVEDMRSPIIRIFHEKDEERRKLQTQLFKEQQLPTFLKNLERDLTDNKDGEGYFIGDKMTWTDILFVTTISVIKLFAEKYNMEFSLEKFPKLSALVERVESSEAIAAWIAKRPETAM
ncbi:hypothetical protein CAPTEDRAFT_165896 [Capitella teleta]|uniref:glutathione transferase n=1 Tax=Capitella teleta TaxID=283909 RepID=R7V6I8_CAPTE|nr:hypothetical protein CAPTEDRAFT_165896 [Capitella teleta]|eukprot:ELU14077.1 hypothetical protein CAPTEDRAFT_165896 [Capitella teleta]